MSAISSAALDPEAVRLSVESISVEGAFHYSARNLYYELIRRQAYAAPSGDMLACLATFRRALEAYEATHGVLAGLVRAQEARRAVDHAALPDVFDYAVRRVLVFDRLEPFLVFGKNGFHRNIEVALIVWRNETRFPQHIVERLLRQLDERRQKTAFYPIHDANRRGALMTEQLRRSFARKKSALVADLGLTFGQAFRAGIPVRTRTDGVKRAAPSSLEPDEAMMLQAGSYAHLEELPPLAMMRWAYDRVSKGMQEQGFG